jgi:hypothetical protein
MLKYSAIGPNVSGGKYESAVTITITAIVITPNVAESVLSVPADSGMNFLFARRPAMATGQMIGRNLASNIITPPVTFHQILLSPRPSNPLPLLALQDVY